MNEKLIFDYSSPGKRGISFCNKQSETPSDIPQGMKRTDFSLLPEVSEIETVRHFSKLSRLNFGVDTNFYPLGSCTMKYNPKINEKMASLSEFCNLHPLTPDSSSQGALELMYNLSSYLCEITGMQACSLQPAAGSAGEFAGLLIMRKYHDKNGHPEKNEIIIPDSAHGTNPASVTLAGFKVVEIKSDERGWVNLAELKNAVNENTAGMMITNPNTLGLFDGNISKIASIVHQAGGLVHYDGANLNAIMGKCRPFDMGFDIVHLNLHKTFSTPHGGGGPGSGPVCVCEKLSPFLPTPVVRKKDGFFLDYNLPDSIGSVSTFYGNFLVMVKAYTYIRILGASGLKKASETAVLNANYLLSLLEKHYHREFSQHCMHEFVLSGSDLPNHLHTLDVAKRLLDYGAHAPTIYFPLIVKESIMVEPTETESKAELDHFADIMIRIHDEAVNEPDKLRNAPASTPVRRLDEVTAARKPELRCY